MFCGNWYCGFDLCEVHGLGGCRKALVTNHEEKKNKLHCVAILSNTVKSVDEFDMKKFHPRVIAWVQYIMI